MMKPTIKIYVGRPVSGAEAKAVNRLYFDLSERGVDALLLVNFTAKSRQIDCVVVTPAQATLLDFKEITGPVRGGLNGPWFIRGHGGAETRYPGENPYGEVTTAKYALSDEMMKFQRSHPEVPPPLKRHFYAQFDAAVCICPNIMPGSTLPTGDFKCWIWGFPAAVEKICTRPIDSSWTSEHWERFMHEHLRLEEVSLEAATDQEYRRSEQMLLAYRARLESVLSHGLPPELPHVTPPLVQAEHFVLLGPSGIGKTIRLQHHALESAKQSAFVLFAEAMYYGGEFRGLLQKAVAPFFGGRIEDLRHSASVCSAPTVLVVDGFDKCKESLRPSLLRDITAFHELCNCRVVVGSKFDPDIPPPIRAQVAHMPHLTSDQKLAVFRFHAGDSAFSDSGLLEPFETAHDLMVAGKCRSMVRPGATHTELYDAYIAQCLPATHLTVAGALCRHLAAMLSQDFSSAMNCHDFEKEAENFVRNSGSTLQVVDAVRQTALVKTSLADFSFKHELIQEHLYADWLCRTFDDFHVLIDELQKPAHRHLAPAVLSRQKSPEKARTILQAVPNGDFFVQVSQGRCGPIAKQVLLQDSHTLLSDAAADLANITVGIKVRTEDGRNLTVEWPELKNCREWSAYETSLARFIAKALDTPDFAERAADLLAVSGASFQHAAATAAQSTGGSARTAFNNVLHRCLVLQNNSMECPVTEIFHGWRSSLFRSHGKIDVNGPWAKALWSRSAHDPGAQAFVVYALCELYAWANLPPVDDLERLFRLAWDSRYGSLRMKALELVTSAARHDVSGAIRNSESIRKLLEGAHDTISKQSMFANTFVIEAMNEYGMIPAPVEVETAIAQVRGVLNPESDYALRVIELYRSDLLDDSCIPLAEEAYRILGLFFEDVFQSVYYDAFHALTEGEQTAFMNLAAQAKDPSFHLGFIFGGLVKVGSPSSLPVFQRYAAGILFDSLSWQDAVESFFLAVAGCAKLDAELPPWRMERNTATDAWRMMRDIIYQCFKGASTSAGMDELWLALRAEASFGVADALFLMKSSFVFKWGGPSLTIDLVDRFPKHVKGIMEHSLLNLDQLASAWKFGESPHHARERAEFVVGVLGRVGDGDTIELLKRFTIAPPLGEGAIAAIKSIRTRNG